MMKQALILVFFTSLATSAGAQETIFSILKRQTRQADEFYTEKNYTAALMIYSKLYDKDSTSTVWPLKIARCAYFSKDYKKAIRAYSRINSYDLSSEDLYYLAESLMSADLYKKAISCYQLCLKRSPADQLVAQKIWRLNNMMYLYEDSLHYAVRSIALNTPSGEFGAVPFRRGIVFVSNRKQIKIVEHIDAAVKRPFYSAYYAAYYLDSSSNTLPRYRKPMLFAKSLFSGFHAGPMSFYDHGRKVVFVSSGETTSLTNERTLQLFFAEGHDNHWKKTGTFPFNSNDYSITDPSMSDDGITLYFSSDMPGGKGGKDIYRCYLKNGAWSTPENLGETINTAFDEVAPHFHNNRTLYFSSSGHPGLGGLDIFKATLADGKASDVENVGYPINSASDDFGINLDSLDAHGYFSSNRKNGGFDDDLYEVDIDLQTYPLKLHGTIRYKEFSLANSSDPKPFARARYYLVDNVRDIVVQEAVTSDEGKFSLVIPYFSKYRLRVIGPNNEEHVVSLEIPKHRRDQTNHEIVIVKDAFK
ncbi:MAG TPA: hypothetical protein VL728_17015 [Cyclobacteriaceae bacterium]|jgi:tetratricopeptide (TPR) repeat protein|nr:hypothetical protein [Cyclobacteriaceae bacterium]